MIVFGSTLRCIPCACWAHPGSKRPIAWLGRLEEAAGHYQVLAGRVFDPNYKGIALARLAGIYGQWGQAERVAPTLERALEVYPQAKTPAARFTILRSALLHGSPEQKAWGLGELGALNPSTLPQIFHEEYERLRASSPRRR